MRGVESNVLPYRAGVILHLMLAGLLQQTRLLEGNW